jgi:polysaccharide biosynthesis transport protein
VTDSTDRQSALRGYVQVVIRRKWLVLGVFGVFVAAAMIVSFTLTPKYRSTVQLRYQRDPDVSMAMNASSTSSTFDAERQLETASRLVVTDEMNQLVAEKLGLQSPSEIDAAVSAQPVQDTTLLAISAVSTDPEQAAKVAQAYADVLIETRRKASLDTYDEAERVISEKLATYHGAVAKSDPAYAGLQYRLQDVLTLKALARGDFKPAAAAGVPGRPFQPNHRQDLIVAIILGGVLAIASAFIAEQFDVRVRSQEDIADRLGLPVVGRIPVPSRETVRNGKLSSLTDPAGLTAEAFRMLRGNLEFVDVDHEADSIMVTSCSASEGKSTTACNLAVTLARAGKKVVVVDADLRRPRVHRYFGLENAVGLTSAVAQKVELSDALVRVEVEGVDTDGASGGIDETGIAPGELLVLPSGPLPPNPGDIVLSRRFDRLISDLVETADMVLVDVPPFMVVGDAAALARTVGGVLMVARLGVVTRPMLREATAFLEQLPCRKLGVVVTQVGAESGYYRYEYRQQADEVIATAAASDA